MTASAPSAWRDRLRSLPVIEGDLPEPGIDERTDPLEAVARWLGQAIDAGLPGPHVAQLSTADPTGRPGGRTLLVKDLDAEGIWFSSSAESEKGRDLAANPRAALTLAWVPLGREVRLSGPVDAPSAAVSADDFRRRSVLARREMLAGTQSAPRGADADVRVARAGELLERDPEAIDPAWTAYRLRPERVEFWASRPGDAALRIRFDRVGDTWTAQRLWT